ncbi:MAG TPA: alpha/beta hydrolase [Acidimicrobiia bacterium]|nr:alpha/beta hydrolase [Acidimicrobiia bacterium]
MPSTHTLDVPGARLYYEERGSGPLLLLIGSPMDSTGFAAFAEALADEFEVVTYDPRGLGHSTREDTDTDLTPEQQAEDVCRLIGALDAGPAYVFGSSGGAVVGLAAVTAHADHVRTLVAHEPPVVTLLPDRDAALAHFGEVYDTFRTGGVGPAMQKFMTVTGLGPPGPDDTATAPAPAPEEAARMATTAETFLGHMLRPTTHYEPDIAALSAAPTRIIVAAGATSQGQVANRTALALADALGSDIVEFPGDHTGFIAFPGECAQVLQGLLGETT